MQNWYYVCSTLCVNALSLIIRITIYTFLLCYEVMTSVVITILLLFV